LSDREAIIPSGRFRKEWWHAASVATFLVDNLNDAGAGSLGQAILDANARPGRDTIDFSGVVLPGDTTPASILLKTALPVSTDTVIVDASIAETRTLPGNTVRRPGVELV
jgi:hypothetical protein